MALVTRFTRTERALHWVNAAFFLLLTATGLILYLPSLASAVGRRPLVRGVHFWGGLAWVAALALVALLGDRNSLLRTARELETLDDARFNVGQKVNAILTAAFVFLFLVSGLLLWLGERDHTFQLASTVTLHDALLLASLVLFLGHLYLAVLHPATRHSLRGITRGAVSEEWARRQHPAWAQASESARADSDARAARTDVA